MRKGFFIQTIIAILIHLAPIIYGISNKYTQSITIKLVFESFSGWGYLMNIFCLLMIFLNEAIFTTKKKYKEKIDLSLFLDHLILTARNIEVSICIGYWAVIIPLTVKFVDSPFSIINKYIDKTWFMILNDFILHALPLTIIFLPFKKSYLNMKKWITLIPFLFSFFLSYIIFSIAYFLISRNLPYLIEYSLGVGWALLVLLLYFLGSILAHSIGYLIFKKRKKSKKIDDLENHLEQSLLITEQEKPQAKIINWKVFMIILLIVIVIIIGCGIGIGLNLKDRETLSKYKISYEEVTTESNQFWNELVKQRESVSISGQDGANDIVISLTNESMWFYGDTSLTNGGFLSNSGMMIKYNGTDYEINYYINPDNGNPGPIFEFTKSEDPSKLGIWPHSGTVINDTTYVYVEFVSRKDYDLWPKQKNFYGMYSAPVGTLNFTRFLQSSDSYPLIPDALILDSQKEYYYAYFIQRPTLPMGGAYLARIHAEKITDPSQPYEFYYGGSKFSRDPKMSIQNSPPISTGVFGQTSACWNKYLNRYVLFQVGVPGKMNSIYVRTAKNLWGPFSSPYLVYHKKSSDIYYCPFIHPELFEGNGRIMYLTYSGNSDGNNRMVKITLDKK
ncbi:hypothetical protein M0811_12088 [Anaeramoeba ignava]|uniref:DUF4185 domain-containing protein n=1 Tax=Anaeramoeba ignava TaxID=1746090 RepID=A0A9Q0L9H7_ANAIG|nr:hypothetical protein M0811_12088 [Anaeramoeba ignava]